MNTRVMVVSDDALIRAGLGALLAELSGTTIVGQASSEDDLQAAVAAHHPDAILWDVGRDAGTGALRLADFVDDFPALPVVALLPDAAAVRSVWGAGARGLLPRDADLERILGALVASVQGFVVLEPAFVAGLIPRRGATDDVPNAELLPEQLTPRELEVLRLLADGLPNKTIAHRLGISEHTVKFHVNAILGKLGVESRTEAVVRATRLGLILL
jgi:DNA-binding NarL/FixJ family response regulator